jgi:hypothetical protein
MGFAFGQDWDGGVVSVQPLTGQHMSLAEWANWYRLTARRTPGLRTVAFAAGVVDNATSRLMMLRFVASQSAFDYFRTTTRAYLETHVKLVALYSAKHNIFRVNNGKGGERVTQFGLALEAPNIDIICANSQQAKGWMERAFGTLLVPHCRSPVADADVLDS